MSNAKPLYETYPVNSVLELTLKGVDEKVKGVVYCTDEISQTVVLKKALTHTTLSSEIFVVQANAVTNSQIIEQEASEEEKIPIGNVSKKALEQQEKRAIRLAEEALQHINQKVKSSHHYCHRFSKHVALLTHFCSLRCFTGIQATPEGQAVFDRLLKACNEVVWKGESIQVLNQIQVDPPYAVDNCRLISDDGRQAEGSLERVKKIVGHSS